MDIGKGEREPEFVFRLKPFINSVGGTNNSKRNVTSGSKSQ